MHLCILEAAKVAYGWRLMLGHQEAIDVFRRGESLAEWTQQPAATAPWGMDGWWTWNTFPLGSFSLANHGSYVSCCSTPPVPPGKDPTKEPDFGGEVLSLGDQINEYRVTHTKDFCEKKSSSCQILIWFDFFSPEIAILDNRSCRVGFF